ncbi:3-deoxy-D-manno-octulosonic acid transferase [Amorphus sp. 3PC139-8]|uniref:3-deoxy-D-manno-octulosonic acid transferase n=1 Tax=Amorphus sp. 3PC139-8 TaxID=2735676 RepID=UPI00345DF05B
MTADAVLYAGWRGLSRVLAPAMRFLLARRLSRGKEDPDRISERRGYASLPRPEGPLVWIHCASVGETNAVLPLIGRLVARNVSVLLTTTTVTGSRVAAKRLPDGAIHQFAPIDVVPFVTRFLGHWQPTLALFVESELWPIALDELSRTGVPRVVVNGRMSKRSARGWSRFPLVHRAIFGRITQVLAQSADDRDRFAALGVTAVQDVGNMKYDGGPLPADPAALEAVRAALGEHPRWLAASTHPGEEAQIAEAHRILAARYPGLVTLIAPRHPERGPAIKAELANAGIAVALRSESEPIPSEGGLYLADTMGELGVFYRVATIVLMGGSLVEKGGQNPIEPGRLGCAVVTGPHTDNFAAVYPSLIAAGGAVVADGPAALAEKVASLIDDPEAVEAMAEAGAQVAHAQSGAVERSMAALARYLPPPPEPAAQANGGRRVAGAVR